jgi:hypothetical protein
MNADGSMSVMMNADLTEDAIKDKTPEPFMDGVPVEDQKTDQPEDKNAGNAKGADNKIEGMKVELNRTLNRQTDYVHVLEISPRGETIGGAAYFSGNGARASEMLVNEKGARLIAGDSDVIWQDYAAALEKTQEEALAAGEDEKEDGKVVASDFRIEDVEIIPRPESGVNGLENMKSVERIVRNGWVMIGAVPKPYEDPCRRARKALP